MQASHSYFAYGSNLCVRQMARRCPGAVDPRPATLADHDWLINERGVATVEPFDGSQVHGVVWQVTDHDLATLDSAEGVPVRYRRDRLTVHTDDGPSEAWVYIDHRVDPGAPRPGYLERIIDGALHHGLPQRWIEFLRRWDPVALARCASTDRVRLRRSHFRSCWPIPAIIEDSTLRSRFGFMAIHGGGLEQMTDVIAERAADAAGASVYVLRHPDHYPHHLPSALYRAAGVRTARRVPRPRRGRGVAARLRPHRAQHPTAGRRPQPRARRTPRAPRQRCPATRSSPTSTRSRASCAALHPDNPVNRVRGGGTQLELTPRVRGISPRSRLPGDDGLSPATSALVQGLVATARSWELTSA